jgi:hypothetical protein
MTENNLFVPYVAWDRLRAALIALKFNRSDADQDGVRIYEPEFQRFFYIAEYRMVAIVIRHDSLVKGLTLETLRRRKARIVIQEQLGCDVRVDEWDGSFIFRIKLPKNLPLAI